jgi:hypothetical protein
MIYAVQTAEGQWTGAAYATRLPDAVRHHRAFGESLVAVVGLEPDGDGWVEVTPTLAQAQDMAMHRLADWAASFMATFTDGVPPQEIASWATKAMAAAAHLAGKPQPIIIGEAQVTGEKPDDLAAIINGKAQLYTAIIARMTGLRRMATKTISQAKSPADVAEALDDALATAHDILAELGLTQET